jgi:hypothetical protein
MEFTLTIKLGNAAMCDPLDVARALKELAEKIASEVGTEVNGSWECAGIIRDLNGNSVGTYSGAYEGEE